MLCCLIKEMYKFIKAFSFIRLHELSTQIFTVAQLLNIFGDKQSVNCGHHYECSLSSVDYKNSANKVRTIGAITEHYITIIKWCWLETSNPNNSAMFPFGWFGNKQPTAPSSWHNHYNCYNTKTPRNNHTASGLLWTGTSLQAQFCILNCLYH